MKVLVLNCGSSSIKYKLFEMTTKEVLAQGGIEKIGLPGSFLKLTLPSGEKKIIEKDVPEHTTGVQFIFDTLTNAEYGAVKDLHEIKAVGHRVLHGGTKFSGSVLIDDAVIAAVEECCDLGPLHNPANLKGIYAVQKLMPEVPQIAVFDTAFHQTMPKEAYMYALPYEYYEDYGIRRYGFHGTSHKYVAQRCAELMGKHMSDLRIITCHLGNGSSVSAIKGGRSIDTTMGFTPLSGLIMGTRTGDIDPAIVPFLMNKTGMNYEEVDTVMNKKSGVLGISGVSSDFRDLDKASNEGNERAKLAVEVFSYRTAKYIGSYIAAMNGVDAIVFTAGLGENNIVVREQILDHFGYMGITLDKEANQIRGEEKIISTPDSKVTVAVIPTNEELAIAHETVALLK